MVNYFLLLISILNIHLIEAKKEIIDINSEEKSNIPYSIIYRIEQPYLVLVLIKQKKSKFFH